jgi:hypothetical protein
MILDRLQKLAPREQAALALAAFCIFAVFADYVVVEPLRAMAKDLDADISLSEKKLKYNLGYMKDRQKVAKSYENVKGLLGAASQNSADIENLKGEIDGLAGDAGFGYESMSHQPPIPGDGGAYTEYFVSIGKFETDIDILLSFMHELRVSSGMLRVAELKVTPGDKENSVKGSIVVSKVMIGTEKKQPQPGDEQE